GQRPRPWRWIGVLASLAGMSAAAYGMWMDVHSGGTVMAVLIGLSVAVAHANLAVMSPLKPGQVWVRWVAIAAVVVTAARIDAVVYKDETSSDNPLSRAAGATGIIAACASLALLIFARLNQRFESAASAEVRLARELSLTCPNCRKKQTIPVGDSACSECGL